jgi:hypothetical protein
LLRTSAALTQEFQMSKNQPGPTIEPRTTPAPRVPVDQKWNDSSFKTKIEPRQGTPLAPNDPYDFPGKTGLK